MAQGDFSQGSGNDPNRIDVSLNIISDAAMAAVKQLTAELTELRSFIASQSQPNAAGRAAAMVGSSTASRQAVYTSRSAETGVYHDVAPAQVGEVPTPNPSETAMQQRQKQAEALANDYRSYVRSVEERAKGEDVPVRSPTPEIEYLMEQEMSARQRMRFHGQELKSGALNRPHPVTGEQMPFQGTRVGRYLDVTRARGAAPEDTTYWDLVGQEPEGPQGRPLGMGPGTHMTMPRAGGMTGQDELMMAAQLLGGGGRVGPEAGGVAAGPTDWEQGLGRFGINAQTRQAFTIPRLGEYTIQDKLNMAAQGIGGMAARKAGAQREAAPFDPMAGDTRLNRYAGRGAQGLQVLAENSAMMTATAREARRGIQFNRGQEQAGEILGFSRESELGEIGIPGVAGARIAPPWASEAGREGWRQQIQKLRMGLLPGISMEEAGEIRQATNQMGYSGETGRAVSEDILTPLKQQGVSTGAVAPMVDEMMRQGNYTPDQVRQSFEGLGKAAQNLRIGIDDTAEAFKEYSDTMTAAGGDLDRSRRNAESFSNLGLDPRLAANMLQNPITRGNLMMESGLPPQMMGATSAAEQGAAISRSYQMADQMSEPFNSPDFVEGAGGRRVRVRSGREKQRAFIQQQTGIDTEVQKRMERNPNWLTNSAEASDMLESYEGRFAGARREKATEDAVERGGGADRGSRRELRRDVTEKRGEITERERKSLQSGGGDKANWEDVSAKLKAMDPSKEWQDKIRRVDAEEDPEKQRKRAAEIIRNANKVDDPNRVKLDLTPDARKLVKQMGGKKNRSRGEEADGGGGVKNAVYQGANFALKQAGDFIPGGGFGLGNPLD